MLSRRTALMGALGASASFGPIAQTQNPPPDRLQGWWRPGRIGQK